MLRKEEENLVFCQGGEKNGAPRSAPFLLKSFRAGQRVWAWVVWVGDRPLGMLRDGREG